MSNEVKIIIKQDGTFTIEVNGVQGANCETLTEALIRNSGEVEERVYNESYHDDQLPDYVESFECDE